MQEMEPKRLLVIALGLIIVLSAVMGWDFIFGYRSRWIYDVCGTTVARAIWFLLGMFVLVAGFTAEEIRG